MVDALEMLGDHSAHAEPHAVTPAVLWCLDGLVTRRALPYYLL
jgi:hypothetical protein